MKVQYPSGWTVTTVPNSQSNILELDGPDNVSFYVDVYKQSGTPAEETQATNDARNKSTQFIFANGPTTDAKVGGEPGNVVSYTVKRADQPTGASTDGVLWIVNHSNSEYDFEALVIGKHRPEIDRHPRDGDLHGVGIGPPPPAQRAGGGGFPYALGIFGALGGGFPLPGPPGPRRGPKPPKPPWPNDPCGIRRRLDALIAFPLCVPLNVR